jgi:hypothetical protein
MERNKEVFGMKVVRPSDEEKKVCQQKGRHDEPEDDR